MVRRPSLRPVAPQASPLVPRPSAVARVEGDAAASQADAVAELVEAQKDELLRGFMDLLGDDPSLDAGDCARIQQELEQALEAVSRSGLPLEAPDPAVWKEAARALHAAGAVNDDEANALVRQLDDALSAFERKESRFALEFSQRMSRDGEDAALEWLRQNRQVLLSDGTAAADATAMSQGIGREPRMLATDAIRSRSGRVRGPPPRGAR